MNIKNIAKGFVLLSFLVGAVIASPAQAENSNENAKAFINANASLKADVLSKLENSVGVVLGPNSVLRVVGAKVTSVSGSDINATASFGNSSLSFVVKTDAETKLNGKAFANSSALSSLKAGDKISFAGTITSSAGSSITVDASHVISQNLYNKDGGKIENKTSFKGEIKAVNTGDNSFTLKLKSGATVKVSVLGSAIITLDGATSNLAALEAGDEVKITGEANADASVITASKISAESEDADDNKENDEDEKDKDNDKNEDKNRGKFWGKIRNWFWK